MIYKFIDNGDVLEVKRDEELCHIKINNVHTGQVMEFYLDKNAIYDLIGALNEIKKRIENK
jgi:hypothetical protein